MSLSVGLGTNVDNGIVKYNVNVVTRMRCRRIDVTFLGYFVDYALAIYVGPFAGCDAIGPISILG